MFFGNKKLNTQIVMDIDGVLDGERVNHYKFPCVIMNDESWKQPINYIQNKTVRSILLLKQSKTFPGSQHTSQVILHTGATISELLCRGLGQHL